MMAKEPRKHRIPIMLSDEELAALDDWQFGNRISTRSNAIRRLLKISATNGEGSMMAKDTPGRGSDQFPLRFPDGMRDELKAAAKANGRSLNAEIIHLIQKWQTATTDQITPRDLFAAAALKALICADAKTVENAVAKSFFIADAMMNERNKGEA